MEKIIINDEFSASCDGKTWTLFNGTKPVGYYQNIEDLYDGLLRRKINTAKDFSSLVHEVRLLKNELHELVAPFKNFVMEKDDAETDLWG